MRAAAWPRHLYRLNDTPATPPRPTRSASASILTSSLPSTAPSRSATSSPAGTSCSKPAMPRPGPCPTTTYVPLSSAPFNIALTSKWFRHATRYAFPGLENVKPETTNMYQWWTEQAKDVSKLDIAKGIRRARAATLTALALPGSAYIYQCVFRSIRPRYLEERR